MTKLERLQHFARDHGFISVIKQGYLTVRIPDSVGGYKDFDVDTMSDLRAVLGY